MANSKELASQIKDLKSQYRTAIEAERKEQAEKTAKKVFELIARLEGQSEEDKIDAVATLLDAFASNVQGLSLL